MERKQSTLFWKETGLPFCGNITFHPSWWNRHCGIEFDEKFWTDTGYRLEADCIMRRYLYEQFGDYGLGEQEPKPRPILGTDLLASGYLFSAMAGCEVLFGKENPPQVLPANKNASEIKALSVETALASPWWQDIRRQAKELAHQFGYVIPCINLQGVQNLALDIRGAELLLDYYEEPECSEVLILFCTDLLLAAGRELRTYSKAVSGGVTAIVRQVFPEGYVHSNCTVEMISNDCYEEYLLPAEQRLADAFSPYGIHHCGQSMEHVCAGYGKVAGLSFAEVGAGSDVKKVRELLGDEIWLNLRYSPVRLMQAGKQELTEELAEMAAAAGGRKKLSVSCVGIDASVSVSRCTEFLEAAKAVFLTTMESECVRDGA